MHGIILRYLGNDQHNCLLRKGNDYEAIDSRENEVKIMLEDVEDGKTCVNAIWVESKYFKPVQHVVANQLAFKNSDWFYHLIGTRPRLEAEDSNGWAVYCRMEGEVKQIAPHIFQIENEQMILIVHLLGNFEQSEKGKVIINHITR